ncbi:MAG: sugar transferase [Planctomycetaceae bacterium]|nr:MAG: sugar transferase [Planctomycetaceae bacterium]
MESSRSVLPSPAKSAWQQGVDAVRPGSPALPRFGMAISERRVLLALVDLVLLNLGLLAILVLRGGFPLSWLTVRQNPHYLLLLSALWVLWTLFFDCYDLQRSAAAGHSAWSAGSAALLTTICYLVIPYITPDLLASRLSALLFVVTVTGSIGLWRATYATILSQPSFQQRILIVGAGESGREMAQVLAATPQLGNPYAGSGYRLVGFVDDDPDKLETLVEGVPVLGNRYQLLRLVKAYDIDLIVVAVTYSPQIHPELFQFLLDCREQGLSLESMTSLYERLTGKVSVQHAGRNLGVVVPQADAPTRHLSSAAKRLVDLAAGLLGLVVLALFSPCVALANSIFSPGPLFYRQERVGKGGRTFWVYKFRSMVPAAERECGAVWAAKDDCRITPVGRILRKTRLDELPQFWNVLKGEMSLIGPRPERPEFVANLMRVVPFYQARHAVRPGITGWAQVRYPYGSSVEDALVKLQYDLYYIKRQSLYLELSIVAKTVRVILGLQGR